MDIAVMKTNLTIEVKIDVAKVIAAFTTLVISVASAIHYL